MNLLKRSRWPGNIRALRNCIERSVILLQGAGLWTLRPEHIHLDDTSAGGGPSIAVPLRFLPKRIDDLDEKHLANYIQWAEQVYFDHAFSAARKNKTVLAERLNRSRDYMHRKLKSLGVGSAAEEAEPVEIELEQ